MRKRRNYKKVLLAVISAVLCLITAFGLTACGKKDGSDGDGGTKVSDKEWQKRLSWEDCESYTYEFPYVDTVVQIKLKSDPSVVVSYTVKGIAKHDLKNNKSCAMVEYTFNDKTVDYYDTDLSDKYKRYTISKVSDGVFCVYLVYYEKVGGIWYHIDGEFGTGSDPNVLQGEPEEEVVIGDGKTSLSVLTSYKMLRSAFTYDEKNHWYVMEYEGTKITVKFSPSGGVYLGLGGDAFACFHSKNATIVTIPPWKIKTES